MRKMNRLIIASIGIIALLLSACTPESSLPADNQGGTEAPAMLTDDQVIAKPADMFALAICDSSGADVTGILTDQLVTLTQNSVVIPEDGFIDGRQPFSVDISFGIPVLGDDPEPVDMVSACDYAEFVISTNVNFIGTVTLLDLMYGSMKVGEVTLTNSTDTEGNDIVVAHVNFNGEEDVFNGGAQNVSAGFHLNMQYTGEQNPDQEEEETLEILDKTFTIQVPGSEKTYSVAKSGVADLDPETREITWTVVLTAAQGSTNLDLEDLIFSDNLTNVGDYVTGSFSVSPGTIDSTKLSYTASTLNYTFPAGSTSPQTVTFKTQIKDDNYYANNSEQTITNTGVLKEENTSLATGSGQVKFTPKWITKTGSETVPAEGTYDPTNRTITWDIVINGDDLDLDGVTVTDTMGVGLTFASATLHSWDGSAWNTTGTSITPVATGNQLVFSIGDISERRLLRVVTNVPDEDYVTGTTTFTNQASITWTGLPDGTPPPGTGGQGVGVGYEALTKKVDSATPAEQKVKWEVSVDLKGQTVPEPKVYDLLVYGPSSNAWQAATGYPSGLTVTDLTAQFNQKYIDSTFAGTAGLSVTVHPIMVGTERIADLLEITGLVGNSINTFTFETRILDPAIFATNGTTDVYNTASFFDGSEKLNDASANIAWTAQTLKKEMLKRGAAVDSADSVNTNRTGNVNEGYDYTDNSVIFRLSVNANGGNLSAAELLSGVLGAATLTDTLPAGWQFVEITTGKNYLIFAGTGGTDGTVNASGSPLNSVSGLTTDFTVPGEATFTFDPLNGSYVILVKARPDEETQLSYFSGNLSTTETNTAEMTFANWDPGTSSSQNVQIDSQILDKTHSGPTPQGEIQWTLDYKPYGFSYTNVKLIDLIPEGVELRLNADGSLDMTTGNFTLNETTLNSDGSYTEGVAVTLTPDVNISYDAETRELTLTIPDGEKGYRFRYLTDVTTEVSITVNNSVRLVGSNGDGTDTGDSVAVSGAGSYVSLRRVGFFSIAKIDQNNAPLTGALFTLFTSDGETVFRSERAVNTNGSLSFRGLPPGTYILEETTVPGGYRGDGITRVITVELVGETISVLMNGVPITAQNPLPIQNFAEGTSGDLIIQKSVAGTGADPLMKFDFTVEFSLNNEPLTGTFTYIGTGIPNGTISSGDTISLADGESIKIIGLPQGALYTVTEADYESQGYITTSEGASGTIVADQDHTAAFLNRREVGELTILKNIEGNGADPTKKFAFTITFTGAPYSYPYTGSGGAADGTITSGDTIERAGGESIHITGLPKDATFTVTETDYAAEGYITTSEGDAGTIIIDENQTATFLNTREVGELTIQKSIEGNGADPAKKFTFTITFTNAPYSYPYTGTGVPDGTITSGDTIELAGGESIHITGLPKDATFTVTEADYNPEGYVTTSSGATGTIITGENQTAEFLNARYLGDLVLQKNIEGNGADPAKKFAFTIVFEGAPYSYPYIGTGVPDGTIQSGDTIELAGGESIRITDLPRDATYTVTEADYRDEDYITSSTGSTGTIVVDAPDLAIFLNERYLGDLVIQKEVEGTDIDSDKKFEFTVEFSAPGEYSYVGTGIPDGTIQSGDTIELAHGESIRIVGLPINVTYTVTEKSYANDGYWTTSEGSEGTILPNETHTARFVNRKTPLMPETGFPTGK